MVSFSSPWDAANRWIELSHAVTEAGDRLVLRHLGGCFEIRINGWELMSNRSHHSEDALAAMACDHLHGVASHVLLGGLGMGYTLRALLDALPESAQVSVAELLPEVIEWNRGPISHLAHRPLDDRRVTIYPADVADLLRSMDGALDAIILDIDNGPDAVTVDRNRWLYTPAGLALIRQTLTPTGILAVWSADRSCEFEASLRAAGFQWRGIEVAARGSAGDPKHTIYLAQQTAT
jgi:spermidine synthase